MTQRLTPHTGQDRLEHRDRAVLVGVDMGRDDWPIEESLAELTRLADTAEVDVVGVTTQRMDHPNPRTFVGSGKVEEVAQLAKELSANLVIFDDELSPRQQLNIEGVLPDTRVIDRTALILEIFAMHAVTREGKLQVDLAQQEYVLPRLARHVGAPREGAAGRRTRRALRRRRIPARDGPSVGAQAHRRAQARAARGGGRTGSAAQVARAQRCLPRGARRLHQRRQVDAAQRPDRRRRRYRPTCSSQRWTPRRAAWRCPRAARSPSPTPSASSTSSRTAWLRRSSRRSTK